MWFPVTVLPVGEGWDPRSHHTDGGQALHGLPSHQLCKSLLKCFHEHKHKTQSLNLGGWDSNNRKTLRER